MGSESIEGATALSTHHRTIAIFRSMSGVYRFLRHIDMLVTIGGKARLVPAAERSFAFLDAVVHVEIAAALRIAGGFASDIQSLQIGTPLVTSVPRCAQTEDCRFAIQIAKERHAHLNCQSRIAASCAANEFVSVTTTITAPSRTSHDFYEVYSFR